MTESEIIACPSCGMEINNHIARCPRCNAVIDAAAEEKSRQPDFPTLDENSGRVEPETL